MISLHHRLGLHRPTVAALLILCFFPAAGVAQSLTFHNASAGPVLIQTSCVVKGTVNRGPTFQLNVNDKTPPFVLPGNKIITIIDSRVPTRILYQGTIPAGGVALSFDIVPDLPVPRVKLKLR